MRDQHLTPMQEVSGQRELSTHIEPVVFSTQPIEQKMSIHLRFDQDQINEEDDEIMLDIFVGESFAARTLGQTHSLSKRAVVSLAISCVKLMDWVATFNANWHGILRASCKPPKEKRCDGRTSKHYPTLNSEQAKDKVPHRVKNGFMC